MEFQRVRDETIILEEERKKKEKKRWDKMQYNRKLSSYALKLVSTSVK